SGAIWQLGDHRLLCGDAIEPVSFERLLAGQAAAMTFTDAPYNVNYQGASGAAIANDNLGDGFGAFLEAACRNVLQHTAGSVYLCMSSSELHTLYDAFTKAGGHWSTFLIWAKSSFTLGGQTISASSSRFCTGGPKDEATTG